ncbi:MAG: hypothetical protein V1709_07070 [Planctomycetota bacterium]
MIRISVDYGNGVIWHFDNYPERYMINWRGFWVQEELPSQTLWI